MRKTGISIIGDVPWGTHFCQFYQTKQDLIDVLVPYFKAGLENNEFCMWVTSEPLATDEAKNALAKAVPGLEKYLKNGQIEIIPHTQWYLKGGSFNSRRVLKGWVDKFNWALNKGFVGLRLTGNTFWLEKKDWNKFTDYEEQVNNVIGKYKMIAICTYSLDKCQALEVIDVVRNHQFALIKRSGKWEIIQSAEKKKAEEEIIHLASFPELNPRPICEVDLEGSIRYLNPAIKRLFPGIEISGIKHPWFADFKTKVMPGFNKEADKIVTREVAIGKYGFEQAITYIPAQRCIRIYGQDITERKLSLESLALERNRLKAIIENTPVGIAVTDEKGGTIQANAVFENIWGKPRPHTDNVNDYKKYKAWWVDTGKPVLPGEWASAQALRTGKSIVNQLLGIKRFDGRQAYIINSAIPFFNSNGKIAGSVVAITDITERKLAEDALRRSEERFRIVSLATNDAVWDWDMATNRVLWNKNIEILFGYPYNASGTDIKWWDEKVHPEDIKRVSDGLYVVLGSNKQFWSQEYRFRRKDNTYAYVLDRGFVMRDAKGKAIRMIGSIMDLTEHKNKELKLQQLNRTLKALSDSSQAMMRATNESDYLKEICRIVVDDCGHAMSWVGFAENDALKTVRPIAQAGFEKGYLRTINITWSDSELGRGPTGAAIRTGKPAVCRNMLTDPNFEPWREEAIKRGYASSIVLPLLYSGKAFGAINIYSKEADPFSKEEIRLLSKLSDDLAYGIMAIRSQVERKLSEENLRQTSDYLESLFNYANAPIICWDVKFKITRFNHAFERLTNYRADEVIGKDLSILFSKSTCKASLNKIKRTLRGEYWEVVEIPILRKDGGIRIVLWNSANVYAEDGKTLLATIAQGQDITARKKMAEALKKANDDLELKISQRTEELMRIQNELNEKRRLSDIGTLAATVAHELRNPLAAVRMAAYNIKRKAQNPILDKHLENIDLKINESEQIINNLLFYSRLKEPSFEQVNLYSVLDECIANTQERFSKLTVKVMRKFDAIKNINIEADPLQMKETFNNILNNAYDAVLDKNPLIEIVGEINDSNRARIIIKDNGIGIDAADLPKLFEPFFSTKAKGTGLGLSVCHQIVRLHDGTIDIESAKGKGTSVSVVLPLARMKL